MAGKTQAFGLRLEELAEIFNHLRFFMVYFRLCLKDSAGGIFTLAMEVLALYSSSILARIPKILMVKTGVNEVPD